MSKAPWHWRERHCGAVDDLHLRANDDSANRRRVHPDLKTPYRLREERPRAGRLIQAATIAVSPRFGSRSAASVRRVAGRFEARPRPAADSENAGASTHDDEGWSLTSQSSGRSDAGPTGPGSDAARRRTKGGRSGSLGAGLGFARRRGLGSVRRGAEARNRRPKPYGVRNLRIIGFARRRGLGSVGAGVSGSVGAGGSGSVGASARRPAPLPRAQTDPRPIADRHCRTEWTPVLCRNDPATLLRCGREDPLPRGTPEFCRVQLVNDDSTQQAVESGHRREGSAAKSDRLEFHSVVARASPIL